MSRSLTPAVESALESGQVRAVLLVSLDFDAGTVRLNNSPVAMQWNGYDWLGAGTLGSIEPVKESADLAAQGLALRLSGVPTDAVASALGAHYQGRACKMWLAPLDAGHRVLADPVLVFSGRMDTMDIELGATATITVTAESLLADWDRPRVRRYNAEDQHLDYPNDKGFEFVPSLVEKQIVWGS